MRKLLLALAIISSPATAGYWFEGGTLHTATAKEWRQGTPANKLATAGDWALRASAQLTEEVGKGDVDVIIPHAYKLIVCVNATVNDDRIDQDLSIATVATLCAVLLGMNN